MYILSFLSIFFVTWYFHDNLRPNKSKDTELIKKNLGEGVKYLGMDFTKTKHVFSMPFGKEVNTEKIQNILSGFLGKRVEVTFDKYLYVQVFNWELKKRYPLPKMTKKDNSKVLLGETYHGKWYHDFLKFPHMIVAGHTGYGKTNFIKTLIPQLDGEILLIDMKNDKKDYKVASARDVKSAEKYLKKYANQSNREKHLFVIVDEAAELLPPDYLKTKDDKEPYLKCQQYLHQIARMGRSRKIHLIFATQYPVATVVPGQIKQNCETRIVFRLPTDTGSEVALDEKGAEDLPAGLYGRAIFKNDRKLEMQTYEVKGDSYLNANIIEGEFEKDDTENENGDSETKGKPNRLTIGKVRNPNSRSDA